ncbi:MarR family winged helix-turn-helix transcriptional regulator [Nocardioides sp. W7]|uniref:MarR family winged helix-turn-helix transcriptional regulator n=1 Tax=Nocardioides sp. W7 TaxID=2931390 RepID=UPI001FD5BD0E|nr:MarR family winged helix-turn-helix transcriptional regulator [Nocardioides sp. W7]
MSSDGRLDLSFLLNQSSYAFAAQLGGALSGLGLTVREFCVLMKAAEGERTQNAVAELAGLDKTTMVSTLDGLEKAGLAERRVSSSDRRARVVAVTPKGRKLLQRAYEVVDEAVESSLSVLDDATRRTFLEALTVLVVGPWATPQHTAPQRRRQPKAAS